MIKVPQDIQPTLNLIIKLEGPAVDEGIDVFKLAPSLIDLGTVIKEANRTIRSGEYDLNVNIRPFQKGSYVMDILVIAQTNAQQLFSNTSVQTIKELLEWIGILAGAGVTSYKGIKSLIELIKWLKGKPPQKIEKNNDGFMYTHQDGVGVLVNENVHKLYQNSVIHEHYYGAYGKLIESEGFDRMTSYLPDQPDNFSLIEKADIPAIRGYTELEISENVDQINTIISETYLNFRRGSYEGLPTNWSFKKGDQIVIATIKDEKFLTSIETGEIRPYAKDLLKVKLVEKQRIRGTEILEPTFEINEVLEYVSAPKQLNVF